MENFKNFILAKKLYIISFFILFVTIIIIIAVLSGEKSSQKTIEQNSSINEPYSKYCQNKTEKYLTEEKNYVAYHYEFQKDSKGSFENKYQYLYDKDTSLIPNNSDVGNYLFMEESYLRDETDEINYYENVLKKDPPKHFIYGPSYIKEDYNKGQQLYKFEDDHNPYESIPETRHLTFRPFRDEKWHQI